MDSERRFYNNYGYGSWDLTKKILLMKPLKGKNVVFTKHFYVFIKQTEWFTSRERKSPSIFISKSKIL